MPLQIRRGPTADRLANTPLAGELVFDTTTGSVYIGNGATAGGLPVTNFSVGDARSTTAKMFLGESLGDNSVHSGVTFTYVGDRLQATVQQDLSNYIGLIAADQGFKGNVWADDSGLIVNSETHTVYGNFVPQGHIIPDTNIAYDLGTSAYRFRDIYLSGSTIYLGDAEITSIDTAVNLPQGSTVGGQPLGINEGDTYNITVSGNIIGTDSTVLVDTTNGKFNGDLYGSVFADDSTILVDARDGVLRGALIGNVTGNVIGDLTGTASTATIASTVTLVPTNSSASLHYLAFTLNSNGDESVRSDTGLTYQPSTNTLATGVVNTTTLNATSVSATTVTGTTVFASTIDTTDSTGMTVVPAITFNSDVTVDNELFAGSNIFPVNSESYDLGSYTKKFRKLYLAEGDNALWIGNATISGNGTAINLPAGSTVGGSAITTAAGSNATTITVNTTGTSADHFVSFFDDQTGDNLIYTDDTFKYNPGTGVLTVGDATIGTVTGNLVGNVTGNVLGNVTGSVVGDLKGSVFADDSTVLVDGPAGVLRGTLIGSLTGNVTGDVTGDITGAVTSNSVGVGSNTIAGSLVVRTPNNGSTMAQLIIAHATAANTSNFAFNRSRGTPTVPTTVLTGDRLGDLRFNGHNGSSYFNSVFLRGEAAGVSGSNVAGRFRILTADTTGAVNVGLTVDGVADVYVSNNLYVTKAATVGSITIDNNKISTSETNADIELTPNGTGLIDFQVVAQSTVGPAGVASALPATPSTYFKIKVNGVEYVVPAYAVA
jgi:hypothetical protein